jgi:hypothetical protein
LAEFERGGEVKVGVSYGGVGDIVTPRVTKTLIKVINK